MNIARSFAVIALVGFLALPGTQVSFGQATPTPPGKGGAPQVPQPVPPATDGLTLPVDQTVPPAAGQAIPPAAAQPLPAVQPLPPAPPDPPAAAPVQPDPAAAIPPAAVQPVPAAAVPTLSLTRGSHIIGSPAMLLNGVRIGTVQDLLSVAGSGEYVLVANPSGFVTIPRSLTAFDPVRRILQVNMTFAQVGELPRLLRLAQLNRQFLGRIHTFFRSSRGEAILRNGIARNGRQTRPPGGPERRAEARPPGGGERRAETRTVGKPIPRPETRPEPRQENGTEVRR
jgi:hypothetical protein